MRSRRFAVFVATVVTLLILVLVAQASPRYRRAFLARYPATEGTKLAECRTCHLALPPANNPYGAAFKAAHFTFDEIEKLDSDKDGATNLAEIKALTYPGDPTDKPGVKGKAGAKRDSTKSAPADSTSITRAPADSVAASDSTAHPRPDSTKSQR